MEAKRANTYRRIHKPIRSKTRRNTTIWAYPGPRQCHPAVSRSPNPTSCLPPSILQKASISLGLGKQSSQNVIADHLQVSPEDQWSFLHALPFPQAEINQLAKQYLRPKQPDEWKSDPDMWLDSNNIRDVMKQYETLYKDFIFLGPFPIDFASPDADSDGKECLIKEICTLDLDKKELEGKKYIGIIFNLDRHDQGGSHWVASFINIPKNFCYYFDSFGIKPPPQIYKFMQWLTIQEPDMKLGWNGVPFQRSNSECGMFSMYFIARMLAKEPYRKFCKSSPSDAFMLSLRKWIFST
jgi:hypothetical protein